MKWEEGGGKAPCCHYATVVTTRERVWYCFLLHFPWGFYIINSVQSKYVKRAEERMRHFFPQYYKKLFPPKRKCKRQLKNVDSFDESCSDFREPLLGDNF